MNLETLETACQVCGTPMSVQVELNPMFSLDTLASMATCDACYNTRYQRVPEARPRKPGPKGGKPASARVPYADD
jgi:hypothetical protein